jgi:N-methylhydantoinase A
VATHLARPLGLDTLAAAHAVRAVANALMAQAIRLMTVERGHDPRGFDYVCFGGAGPVHALDLARSLEMGRVLVPPVPGLFSALGMVLADRQSDLQAAVDRPLSACDESELGTRYAAMEQAARQRLPADAAQSVRRRADCRYAGQPDSIMVDVEDCAPEAIRAAFEAAHLHLWNFTKPDQAVLLNNIRVEARAATGWRGALRFAEANATPAPCRTRRVQLGAERGTAKDLPVWRRRDLLEGFAVEGPAVIEEASSSLTLGPGDVARIGAGGVLVISLAVESRPASNLAEALA